MNNIRYPAVAGVFYPADPQELRNMLVNFLKKPPVSDVIPKALIVPHAGYIYSGAIAATAYNLIKTLRSKIERVVLMGPSHRVAFSGVALSSATWFITPLGKISLTPDIHQQLAGLSQITLLDQAHAQEHSLEVQLPFLQEVLGEFLLIPLVVGDAPPALVAQVLERVWGGAETLIVISSDLSHYQDYDTARQLDTATSQAIEKLMPDAIKYDHACGRNPINGLLTLARRLGMKARTLDLRNSGDTAGSCDRVVGYGAYTFTNS